MRPIRKGFFWGLAIGTVVALLATFLLSHLFPKPDFSPDSITKIMLPPSFPPKAPVDFNWTVKRLDGQDLAMAAFKGKVIFLTFWATWCAPCIAELPSIQRLHEKLRDEQVAFVCASPEEIVTVSNFVQENGYTLPMFTFEGDPPGVFEIQGYPTTFIIAPDGRIAFRHRGTAIWDDDSTVDFIKGLLH